MDEGPRHACGQLELDWIVVLPTPEGIVRLHHLETIVGTLTAISDRNRPVMLAPLHPLPPSDMLIPLNTHVEMDRWTVLWHIKPCVHGDSFTFKVVGLLQLADKGVTVPEVLLLGVTDRSEASHQE